MKQSKKLKAINTNELEFKDREDFLKWRDEILDHYEQSKIEYQNEMNQLFGYDTHNTKKNEPSRK